MLENKREKNNNQPNITTPNIRKNQNEKYHIQTIFIQKWQQANKKFLNKRYQQAKKIYLHLLQQIQEYSSDLQQYKKISYFRVGIKNCLLALFQINQELQQCHYYCCSIQNQIDKILNKQDINDFLMASKMLIQLKFQHCAILSQLKQHEKALESCDRIFEIIFQRIQVLINFIEQNISQKKKEKSQQMKINYSYLIYQYALNTLKKLQIQTKKYIYHKIQNNTFYFWEKNIDQNKAQLQKKFKPTIQEDSKRSILGVKKHTSWICDWNIGKIMRIKIKSYKDFIKPATVQQYLFKDNIYEIIIHCSLIHFMVAAQMRFLNAQKQLNLSTDVDEQISKNIIKKYGTTKNHLKYSSQNHHLLAINIMRQSIDFSTTFLNHLLNSYQKNYIYEKKLDEIISNYDEQSQIFDSFLNQNNIKIVNHYQNNLDYYNSSQSDRKSTIKTNCKSNESSIDKYKLTPIIHSNLIQKQKIQKTIKNDKREDINKKKRRLRNINSQSYLLCEQKSKDITLKKQTSSKNIANNYNKKNSCKKQNKTQILSNKKSLRKIIHN